MCSDCRFAGAVTPSYKIHSTGEAVSGGHKNYSAGKTVSTGHKTGSVNFVPGRDKTAAVDSVSGGYKNHSAGVSVTTGYKIHSAGEAVTTGYKIYSAGEVVSGGHKTDDGNFVPTGDKTGSANFVPGRDKTDGANFVPTGDKTTAAAITASAKYMDACAGAAWMLFAVTARDGMAWTVAGRGTFAVTGCFLLLPFGMRCAGYGYVVMNSFFACRDDFIFSQFVISFLPLKEPLRVRGDFSLLEVL